MHSAEHKRSCNAETIYTDVALAAELSDHDKSWWEAVFVFWLLRITGQQSVEFASMSDADVPSLKYAEAAKDATFASWKQCIHSLAEPGVAYPRYIFGSLSEQQEVDLALFPSQNNLALSYNPTIFNAEQITEFLQQIVCVADQINTSENRNFYDYSLVTPSAKAYLPDPAALLSSATAFLPVHETILERAEHNPFHIAIEYSSSQWTYHQLASVSAQIAAALITSGLQAGEVVAVTGSRSFGFIAAMLGVFRSGGVLLNIDPALPVARQQQMVEVAGAQRLVWVQSSGAAEPVLGEGIKLSCRVTVNGEIVPGPNPAPDKSLFPSVQVEQPAYVFFTSGSTGTPKAVLGRHAGLAHFLHWQRNEFAISASDRASQLTALSFDVILRDALMVLTAGGTLCIPGENDILEPERIIQWLREQKITVLHVVPSLARLWLSTVAEGIMPLPLKSVFFAGEPLTDSLVQKWKQRLAPNAAIINLYGPTETTLAKCFYRVPENMAQGVQPIGQPLPQTQILILNSNRQLCGVGEPGEIAIRTPFRTLGYLRNPEANANAFIQNPFSHFDDDLIYLTGDGGCYRADGLIAIHGRIDNQIKIRGIRIEPGEIEAALTKFGGVKEAIVIGRLNQGEEKELVAYVVPKDLSNVQAPKAFNQVLREHLKALLPAALIPAALVLLPALPLNPNGKINRLALPAPDPSAYSTASYVAPTTEIETALVQIWEALLHRTGIGIDDDFFDLGGHSLLAVQLVHQIKVTLNKKVTLPTLFRCRNIRALAHEFMLDTGNVNEAALLTMQSQGEPPGLFCLVGLHLYQELADQLAPDIPVHGIFLPFEENILESSDEELKLRSIEELAAGYIDVIKAAQPQGPYMLCGVSFGGVMAYEVASQLDALGEEVGLVAMLDSRLPSATRRNWPKWFVHKCKQFGSPAGFRQVLSKVLDHAKPQVANFAAVDQNQPQKASDELEQKRQDFYRNAEKAYVPRQTKHPVVLVRAEIRMFEEYDLSDPSYGWAAAAQNLTLLDAPGDHLGILEGENVVVMAERLRPHLAKARGK